MSDNQTLNHDSPAVLGHLQIVQGVIQRMAVNSRSCKVWCVTLSCRHRWSLVARPGAPTPRADSPCPDFASSSFSTRYYLALERAVRVFLLLVRGQAS